MKVIGCGRMADFHPLSPLQERQVRGPSRCTNCCPTSVGKLFAADAVSLMTTKSDCFVFRSQYGATN